MLNNCNLLPATKPGSTKGNYVNITKEVLRAAMAEGFEEEEEKEHEEQGKE